MKCVTGVYYEESNGTLIGFSSTDPPVLNTGQSANSLDQPWFTFSEDLGIEIPGDITPWVDDLFEGHVLDGEIWHDFPTSSSSSARPPVERTVEKKDYESPTTLTRQVSQTVGSYTPSSMPVQTSPTSNTTENQLHDVPDHLLAQHYTRNLTARYSSKNAGWNFYMHAYNRFTGTHPFVSSALYAWTSAHLFYAGAINSLDNAISHYQRSAVELNDLYKIDVNSDCTTAIDEIEVLASKTISDDDVDAIAVALYFLASTDQITSRSEPLRSIIRCETVLLLAKHDDDSKTLFSKIATWFCFIDARSSIFGASGAPILQAMGGENGLVRTMYATQGLLKREYNILYPIEEQHRDEFHFPLLEIISRLIAIFGSISQQYNRPDESAETIVRASLDHIQKVRSAKSGLA